jgi:very-short-patch-repair endonuclease
MRSTIRAADQARALRKALTPPEALLWTRLRGHGQPRPKFRRQHPIGPYVLDFYCALAKLAIEVDGQSHGAGDRPQRDLRRDAYLARLGIRVIRYPASEVMADPNGIANAIFDAARG